MSQGLLIILSGPSGVGKGTVCSLLASKNRNLYFSISMTTRPPRPNEQNGVSYFFVSEEEFKKLIENDSFLEWAKVYGHYYGTPRSYVSSHIMKGKDVLLEIDTQGANKIKTYFPDEIFIFLLPPSLQELKRRIMERGTELPAKIEERYTASFLEIKEVKNYDYIAINDSPERAAEQIAAIIEAEKCRVKRNRELLERLRRGDHIKCL
ncbi:MAG: guanylate kinase [Firmicutes bacterium HGW-Firmicutes-13]|nr:MAG: guanylate kinase [Firmicutes bacterium HGW-Firmicutes-13]